MVLTGRAGVLAAAGVVFVGLVMPRWAGVGLVVLVVLTVCVVDMLLAGSPRRLQFTREGDNAVRLGEQAVVQLLVTNPGRRVRGLLRDAWPPSAGVLDPPHKLDLPSIHSGEWDPVLAACQETDTVVCLHVGSSGMMDMPEDSSRIELGATLFGALSLDACANWLWSGVPVRFPDLKICLSEGGIG